MSISISADDVFGALLLVAAAFVTARGLPWNKLRMFSARSWPLCQGRIESGLVLQYSANYFNYYSAQLAYSYSVNGEYYSGFHSKFFFRKSSAQCFVDELKGKPTFVRHKPNNAEISTILREDQQSVWPLQI